MTPNFPINHILRQVEEAVMDGRHGLVVDWDELLLDVRDAMDMVVCPHNGSPIEMDMLRAAREAKLADPEEETQ